MPDANRPLSEGKIVALKLLKQALDDARDVRRDRWQFAIRKETLLDAGATVNDLRWLISCRLVEEAREITGPSDPCRVFGGVVDLALHNGACFVLSHGGRVFVRRHLEGRAARKRKSRRRRRALRRHDAQRASSACNSHGNTPPAEAPRLEWRPAEGELHFRGELAWRRGRKVARFEELLLERFTTVNGGCSVANPFGDALEASQQLKETVRRLNKSLLVPTLRFHVHHDGASASWEDRAADA